MLFSFSQLFKAKNIVRKGQIKLEIELEDKYFFKVKDYEVVIDKKNNKCSCTCIYFSLFPKNKICSHIIAAYLFLEGENWIKENLRKNKEKLLNKNINYSISSNKN